MVKRKKAKAKVKKEMVKFYAGWDVKGKKVKEVWKKYPMYVVRKGSKKVGQKFSKVEANKLARRHS